MDCAGIQLFPVALAGASVCRGILFSSRNLSASFGLLNERLSEPTDTTNVAGYLWYLWCCRIAAVASLPLDPGLEKCIVVRPRIVGETSVKRVSGCAP